MFFLEEENAEGSKKRLAVMVAFLTVYSLLVYCRTIENGFVWDSYGVFVNNENIKSFSNALKSFLGSKYIGGDVSNAGVEVNFLDYYRPLATLLHYFEYSVFGDNALYYKLINLFLNIIVILLSFWLVLKVTRNTFIAFFSVLVYSSVPARGEVVYWAYSDTHILGAIFVLLSLVLYVDRKDTLCLVFFVLGLLFHESVLLLPILLVTYDLSYEQNDTRYTLRRISPFVVFATVFYFFRSILVGSVPIKDLPFVGYLNLFSEVLFKHFKLVFVQDNAVSVYRYDHSLFIGDVLIIKWLFLFFIVAILVYCFLKKKEFFFWGVFFLLPLPLSLVGGSYYYYIEKTLYLASLGIAVILATLLWQTRSGLLLLIFITFIAVNSYIVLGNSFYWKNTETYLTELVRFDPDFDLGYFQLGNEYLEVEQYEKSIENYEKALLLRPEISGLVKNVVVSAYLSRAFDMYSVGNYEASINSLLHYLKRYGPQADVFNAIGNNYVISRKYELAIAYYEKAIGLSPDNALYRANLAFAMTKRVK